MTNPPLFLFRFTSFLPRAGESMSETPDLQSTILRLSPKQVEKRVIRESPLSCHWDVLSFMSAVMWFFVCSDMPFHFFKRFVRRSIFYGARRNPTLTQRLWIWHIHIYLVYMHTSTTLVATASNWIKDPLIICQGVLLCSWKPNLCANGSSSGK